MQRQKVFIIIAALLIVGFLLYLVFSDNNKTKEVSIKTETASINQQLENIQVDTEEEEEEQLEADNTGDNGEEDTGSTPLTITEEIKENVREVLEGVVNLFKKDLKIVSIGDSLTQGVGDETEQGGYVGILNNTFEDNKINISIENFGKRGNRTDQLLKRLDNEEIAASIKEANIVLITIGANDIMKIVKSNFDNLKVETFERERQGYTDRLTSIFKKVNKLNPDTQIYLIGFYNPFEGYFGDIAEMRMIMDNWNEAGRSVTEEFDNVHYIPVADLFFGSNLELLADDYFHPNTRGYKLMAERVLEHLKEISIEPEKDTEVLDSSSP